MLNIHLKITTVQLTQYEHIKLFCVCKIQLNAVFDRTTPRGATQDSLVFLEPNAGTFYTERGDIAILATLNFSTVYPDYPVLGDPSVNDTDNVFTTESALASRPRRTRRCHSPHSLYPKVY